MHGRCKGTQNECIHCGLEKPTKTKPERISNLGVPESPEMPGIGHYKLSTAVGSVNAWSPLYGRSRSRGRIPLYKTPFTVPPALFSPFPFTVLDDMVASGLRLSEHPHLEKYIKDEKLVMPDMFSFRKQPIKGLYIIYRFTLLLVLLPSWILRYALPSWRPRRSWTLTQAIWVRAHSYSLRSFSLENLSFIRYSI